LEIEIWDLRFSWFAGDEPAMENLFGICDLEFEASRPPEGTGFLKKVKVSLQKMKFIP
jgi:hypothetical protein